MVDESRWERLSCRVRQARKRSWKQGRRVGTIQHRRQAECGGAGMPDGNRGTGPATRREKGNKGKESGRDGIGGIVRMREYGV
jgi:hypothetical protein